MSSPKRRRCAGPSAHSPPSVARNDPWADAHHRRRRRRGIRGGDRRRYPRLVLRTGKSRGGERPLCADACRDIVGAENVLTEPKPMMGSEDFADMLLRCRAAIAGSAMAARCRCTIPASSSTTRSCRSARACWRGSSKPACRWPPMHKPSAQEGVTSLHDLSAVDLIAGFRAKQFSPSEVLEDVLAHIAVWEPHIKALYAFDPDGARAVARASTERWQKDQPMGPLDGVPATIKENIPTKGVPVPLGAAPSKLDPAWRMPRRRRGFTRFCTP